MCSRHDARIFVTFVYGALGNSKDEYLYVTYSIIIDAMYRVCRAVVESLGMII
jgi:hypothetical protein